MNFFWKEPDVNLGIKQFVNTPDAILIDVRTRQEFAQGHIPNSRNIPFKDLKKVRQFIPDLNTPLFVICLNGAQSNHAVFVLRHMGYRYVEDNGGIDRYRGQISKGAS